jgi:iron complex transport system permease protein
VSGLDGPRAGAGSRAGGTGGVGGTRATGPTGRGTVVAVPPPAAVPPPRAFVGSAAGRACGLVALGLAVAGLCVASLVWGSTTIGPGAVLDALRDPDGSTTDIVVRQLRVPRTLLGLEVGVALGLAGALMQAVSRNPLADPGLLGVNAGASAAVVFAIHVLGVVTLTGYIWFAFVGAAVAAVVVYGVGAAGRDGPTPVRLALAGAALTALLSSLTQAVLVTDTSTLDAYRFWVVGSLSSRTMDIVTPVAPFIAVGVVLALALARPLNALALGDDVARSLGQPVGLVRAATAATAVLLAGSATAAAGPIVFLGLAVPHMARVLAGDDLRWSLVYSAALGPALLIGADVVGRVVSRPGELQVGIVTALLGAPLFIALIRRRRLAVA